MTLEKISQVGAACPSILELTEIVFPKEEEKLVVKKGEITLNAYKESVEVRHVQSNCDVGLVRLIFSGLGDFFSFGGTKSSQLIEKLVERQVRPYVKLHGSKIPKIFDYLLSGESEEILSTKIAALVHVFARLNSIADLMAFKMVTWPESYKGISYADALEFLQRLVNLYERGLVNASLVRALEAFHSTGISLEKLLIMIREVECEDLFPQKESSSEKLTTNAFSGLECLKTVISGGSDRKPSSLVSLLAILKAAEGVLNGGSFSLLLNPISYYHVTDIAPMKSVVHLIEIVLQKRGSVDLLLRDFYKARLRDCEKITWSFG